MQTEKKAIRLTNKTAIALRRTAKKVQNAYRWTAIVLTVILAVVSVILGMRWLPAVPLVLAAAVGLDAALFTAARSKYLHFVSQAICTEAAARNMRGENREDKRKRQAMDDVMKIKADLMSAFDGEDDDLLPPSKSFAKKPDAEQMREERPAVGSDTMHRRRRPFTVIKNEQVK